MQDEELARPAGDAGVPKMLSDSRALNIVFLGLAALVLQGMSIAFAVMLLHCGDTGVIVVNDDAYIRAEEPGAFYEQMIIWTFVTLGVAVAAAACAWGAVREFGRRP